MEKRYRVGGNVGFDDMVLAHLVTTSGSLGQEARELAERTGLEEPVIRQVLDELMAVGKVVEVLPPIDTDFEPCGEPYVVDGRDSGMRCCRVKGHEPPHADCVGGDGFECVDPKHAADDEAIEVFEATRAMRNRATAAVMAEGDETHLEDEGCDHG